MTASAHVAMPGKKHQSTIVRALLAKQGIQPASRVFNVMTGVMPWIIWRLRLMGGEINPIPMSMLTIAARQI